MRKKITIVGAGNVGSATAQRMVEKGLADVVLVDKEEGIAKGKALDILESAPLIGFDCSIIGTKDYSGTEGSHLIVIAAGLARRPGMSREDLLAENARIVSGIVKEVKKASPEAVMIVVTNPVDQMTYLASEVSGFPRYRVMGMGGILDSARFRTFVAIELKVSVKNVDAFVLGGHGDTMVPLPRYCTISGIPLTRLLSKEKIDKIVERTRMGGAEIVDLLKTGSAYYAPSAAIGEMAEAILMDRGRVLPCSVYLKGEYGIDGLYVGVPAKLGARGVIKVIEAELDQAERDAFMRSVEAVRKGVAEVSPFLRV